MKITAIETIPVACPLEEPLRWGAFEVSSRGAILVRVTTDEGIVGWGEAGFFPNAYPMIKAIIADLIGPILVGRDPFDIERLWEEMFRATHKWGRRGLETYAVSGIDIALWDIIGKALKQPVYRILGAYQERIPAYSAPALRPPQTVEKETAQALEKGFRALKLRMGLGMEQDREILLAARKVAGDTIKIMVDPNMAYNYYQAVEMSNFLADHGVVWVEEPIYAASHEQYIREHRRLAQVSRIPLAGGECFFTRYEFGDLITQQVVQIVQPDCAGVGGITEARKIAAMASAFNLVCVPHIACSSFSALGFAANLQLVGATPNAKFIEFDAYDSPIRRELLDEPIEAVDGYVSIPDRPGLGIGINEKMLAKYRVDR